MAGVHAGVRGAFLKAQVTLRTLHGEACVQLPFALVCILWAAKIPRAGDQA